MKQIAVLAALALAVLATFAVVIRIGGALAAAPRGGGIGFVVMSSSASRAVGYGSAHPTADANQSRRVPFGHLPQRLVPLERKACPSAASARALAGRLAQTHVGVIAWSRTGDPELGDWGPPVVLVRTGVIPDEFEAGGGVE